LLRRVLNLECLRPVPVGTVIEIEGAILHRAQAYLVTGLVGTPLKSGEGPWLEALLGFAQVDEAGRPDGLPEGAGPAIQTTKRLRPSAATSESMCPASASSARELVSSPPTTSATMYPAATIRVRARRRRLPARCPCR
jgi:hypothetical protein